MSALGQKQTCAAHKPVSALPPTADMCGALVDVIADIHEFGSHHKKSPGTVF